MTLYTIRPNATVQTQNVNLFVGATADACLNDNNDSSGCSHYFSGVSLTLTGLADLPGLAAGEQVVRVRVRARWTTGNGNTDFYALVESSSGQQVTPDYYTGNIGAMTSFTGPWRYTAPDGGAWTAAKVNDLRLRLQDNGGGTTKPWVSEGYVDVETNFQPTTTVSAPTGTIANTSKPAVSASYVDSDLDPQDAYQIKVFDSATYGGGSFSPDTSTPVWDSGTVLAQSAPSNIPVGLALPNGAYRAYVRVRQAGGVITQWSAWAFSAFTMAVTPPAAPGLTVTADSGNGRNTLAVQDRQNMLTDDDASFESSAGSWIAITNGSVARSTAQAFDGAASLAVTSIASGRMDAGVSTPPATYLAVSPGALMTAMAAVRAATAGRSTFLYVYWYDASRTQLSSPTFTTVGSVTDTTTTFLMISGTVTVPAGAAFARLVVSWQNAGAANEVHYVDMAGMFPGNVANIWSRGGLASSARLETQRSTDGGATWAAVKRLYVPGVGVSDLTAYDYSDVLQNVTAYDYEAALNTGVQYRIRVNALLAGNTITSPWSAVSAAVTLNKAWWLKSLTDPANYAIKPNFHGEAWELKSTERLGVFLPLGRSKPVILSDVIGGETGTLTLAFLDDASYNAFEALRGRRESMLIQTPYGENRYIRLGADRTASYPLGYGSAKRTVTVPFFEVDAP